MSVDTKIRRAIAIGAANSGTLESRFGVEQARLIKQKISDAGVGRHQSHEERLKRVQTRRENNVMLGRPWITLESKQKISLSNKRTHSDPDYETLHADSRRRSREKQSQTMKRKIENGEFTPKSNNWKRASQVRLNVLSNTYTFRSRWEAAYWLVTLSKTGERLEYERIRVPYTFGGIQHVYIVDFLSRERNELIEVRPKCRQSLPREVVKLAAARDWALKNSYTFVVIDEDWLILHRNDIKCVVKEFNVGHELDAICK